MKPDVFLISIDCLRPDYLGIYNTLRRQSPRIDEFFGGAVVFTQAVSHAPFTTPAVASMLTGSYPLGTGVRLLLGQLCDPSAPTVAGCARQAGYLTAGFPSNFILNSCTGLNRGFDCYRDIVDGVPGGRGGCWQTGDRLNAALDDFLGEARGRPVFCWIHYFDLHDYHLDTTAPAEVSYARDLRDKIDGGCFCEFLDVVSRHDRLESSAFIMTADHGECLFQHGHRGHGHHLYDSVLRVPLIWKWPSMPQGPARIDRQVRHVDILPSLLDLWGIPPGRRPGNVDGRSLLPLLRGGTLDPAPSYAEASPRQLFKGDITAVKQFTGPEQQSIRTEQYKFIRHEDGRCELYDLLQDPFERCNLSGSLPQMVGDLQQILRALLKGDRARFGGAEVSPAEEALVVQRLRDLGYVA